MADEIYEAIFSSYRHQNDSGFAVAQMTDRTLVVGELAGHLLAGVSYSFHGRWKNDERFGKQFRAKSFKQTAINTEHGVISYLSRNVKSHGLGPVTIRELWDKYGIDSVKILRTDPERACREVKRLRLPVAMAASAELAIIAKYESVSIAVTDVLAGRGFAHKLVDEVVRKWKLNAAEIIKRDPFKLVVEGFASCGFNRVYRLYTDIGLPLTRLKVLTLCIWHGLKTDSSGSTWHLRFKAKKMLESSIGAGVELTEARIDKAIRLGIRARWLSIRKDQDGLWIAEHEKAMDEWRLAEKLKAMRLADAGPWLDCDSITGITEHQRAAAKVASSSNVGILGGPPGSGKSYTLAAMLKAALKKFDASEIAVCSPTGKASVRIAQALLDNGVSDISATTIHRLLKPTRNGHDGKKWGFFHGKDARLPHKLVVCEEASMCDTGLAADLLESLNDDAMCLFVGDFAQLPPISHGKPLLDLIDAGYPFGALTEIHRNAGDIVRCSQECKAGKPFTPSTGSDWKNGQNVWIYQRASQGQQLAALKAVYENAPEQFDRFRGMVTLSVTNESSDVARKSVNLLLQELLNPSGVKVGNTPFRIGDRAICLENGDATEIGCMACGPLGTDSVREFHGEFACLRCGSTIKKNEMEEGFLANGEMGTVIDSGGDGLHILFDYPRRVIRFVGEHHTRCDLGFAISTHRCVSPDTVVETPLGLMPISSLPRSGGVIATGIGAEQYANFTHIAKPEKCVRVLTKDGYEITVSLDHKCEIIGDDCEGRMVLASELQEGDTVRLRLGETTPITELASCEVPQCDHDVRSVMYKTPKVVTEELAEMIGLMVADGTIYRRGFRVVKRHDDVIKRFSFLCKRLFGYENKECQHGTGARGSEVNSAVISYWLRSLGGMSPNSKDVPDCIMRSPLRVQCAFIRGLFEDGGVNIKNGKVDHVEFTSVYPPLRNKVRTILLRMGIACGRTPYRDSSLFIYGAYAKRFADMCGFMAKTKNDRLANHPFSFTDRYRVPCTKDECHAGMSIPGFTTGIREHARATGHVTRRVGRLLAEAGVAWAKERIGWHYTTISKIEQVESEVMCVEVPGSGRFLQNGFAWGNSQGSSWPLVVLMADDSVGAAMVSSRQLVLTAISRAEKLAIVIGKKSTVDSWIQVDAIANRKTFLSEALK